MAHGSRHEHAQNGNRGVTGALSGQDQLAERAAAGQDGCEPHHIHPQEVPEMFRMCDHARRIESHYKMTGRDVVNQHHCEEADDHT